MIAYLLRDTLAGLGLGLVAAFGWWYFDSHKRRALRFIDLTSYFLTSVAFGSGLFAVWHYQDQMIASLDRLEISSLIVDADFDAAVAYNDACPSFTHSPFRLAGTKRVQCDQMGAMLRTTNRGGDLKNPNVARLPDIAPFTIPELKAIAKTLVSKIDLTNEKITAYKARHESVDIEYVQILFLGLALPTLAFAFGFGLARRTLDLYGDWDR